MANAAQRLAAPEGVLADFAARFWEREAAALPHVWAHPPVPGGGLLRAAVNAAERWRAEPGAAQFSFFVDGDEIDPSELGRLLPRVGEPSLQRWADRVHDALRGAEFTLLLADPHLHDRALWGAARGIARDLFAHTGIPCGGADTALFMGCYKRTPFGVHRGQMSVVTFPTEGTKRFRLWPRGYGEAHADIRDSLAYETHLSGSFELSGDPGDVLYWPADLWHVAEGSGALTAAWNIGFWWDGPPLARVLGALAAELEARAGTPDPRGVTLELPAGPASAAAARPGGLERLLPSSLRQTAAEVAALVAAPAGNGGALETVVAGQWLRLLSADGFRATPPPLPPDKVVLDVNDVIEIGPDATVLWGADAAGRLHVGALGHTVVMADAAPARDLLARLWAREAVPIHDLVTAHADVQRLLGLLLTTGAARRSGARAGAGGAR